MPLKNRAKYLELSLVAVILAIVYLPNLSRVEFHPDESQWIAASNVFESYVRLEFKSEIWERHYLPLLQPPVACYTIGLGRFIGGYRRADLNKPWDFEREDEFNELSGARPSDGLLWWSRLPMAILGILSIELGFLLLRKSSTIAAYAWLGLVMVNPYFTLHLRHAMGESVLVFFSMLTLYLATRALTSALPCQSPLLQARKIPLDPPFSKGETGRSPFGKGGEGGFDQTSTFRGITTRSPAERPCPVSSAQQLGANQKRDITRWLLLAGITSGLAGEAKLNGIVILGTNLVIAVILGYLLNDKLKEKVTAMLRYGLVTTVACIFGFLAINPFLWTAPIARSVKMFTDRAQEMSQQTLDYSASYMDLSQRIRIIPARVFHDFASLPIPAVFNFVLIALGVLITLHSILDLFSRQAFKPAYVTFLSMAFFAATPIWLSQLDWDRYYMYPVLFATAFTAIAIDWIIRTGLRAGKKYILPSAGDV